MYSGDFNPFPSASFCGVGGLRVAKALELAEKGNQQSKSNST